MSTINACITDAAGAGTVAQLAYDVYIQEGAPADRALQHWLSAEAVLSLGATADAPLRVRYADGQVWIGFVDAEILELEEVKQNRVRAALNRIVDALPHPRLIIDMHNVNLLASALLGTLGALSHRVHEKGGALRLVGLTQPVRGELAICHLDRVLDLNENPRRVA